MSQYQSQSEAFSAKAKSTVPQGFACDFAVMGSFDKMTPWGREELVGKSICDILRSKEISNGVSDYEKWAGKLSGYNYNKW
jgi:hypothetical protein